MRYAKLVDHDAMEGWRNKHLGETMIVCGCGPSIANIPRKIDVPTIGVNDIWAYHEARYVLMIDSMECFKADRVARIEAGKPEHYFLASHAEMSWRKKHKPRMPHTIFDDGIMPGNNITTPSLAIGLAMFMGAKRVGVIGVDLTDHPTLKKRVAQVQKAFSELMGVAWMLGDVELVNLSEHGADILLRRRTPEKFLAPITEGVSHGIRSS